MSGFEEVVLRPPVRSDVVARLKAAFPAMAPRIYSARRWPTMAGAYPALLVYMLAERGTLRSDAAPSFKVDATLALHFRVEGASESAIEDAMNDGVEALKGALLQDGDWVGQFEAVTSFDISLSLNDAGETLLGEALMTIGMQWNEDQFPWIPNAFASAAVTRPMPDGDAPTVGLTIALPTP